MRVDKNPEGMRSQGPSGNAESNKAQSGIDKPRKSDLPPVAGKPATIDSVMKNVRGLSGKLPDILQQARNSFSEHGSMYGDKASVITSIIAAAAKKKDS